MKLKKVTYFVISIILCIGMLGCATNRKDYEERLEARHKRVEYYEREALEWRRDGVESIGVYFEEKAKKEKSVHGVLNPN